jgi:hypothetical protein
MMSTSKLEIRTISGPLQALEQPPLSISAPLDSNSLVLPRSLLPQLASSLPPSSSERLNYMFELKLNNPYFFLISFFLFLSAFQSGINAA